MKLAFSIKKIMKEFVFFVLDGLSPLFIKEKPINKKKIKKILVAECGGIGDLIRMFPAVESLHANFPTATFSLLTSPNAQRVLPLFRKADIFSEIIEYDPTGRHKAFMKRLVIILLLRKKHYDLIFAPNRGSGMRENIIMNFLIGSPHRMGFWKGRVGFLNTVKVEFKDDIPILQQNLAILKAANLKVSKEEIELKIPEEDIVAARKIIAENNLHNVYPLITIHPGAQWNALYRCLPLEKYIALVKIILEEFGARIIIIGGKEEVMVGEKIIEEVQSSNVVNAVGKTTVAEMAAIIKLSHLFIGNDSGPLHIALAMNIPSVAIFGATSPDQVLSTRERCILIKKDLPSLPLYLHQPDYHFRPEHTEFLDLITIEDVMNGIRRALET